MTARTPRRSAVRSRIAAVGALAVAGALVLTGCGDQTKSAEPNGGGSKESGNGNGNALFAKLPAEIQKKGTLEIGTNAEYAPMESKEGDKIVGVDPDLAAAIGEKLGVKVKLTDAKFDTLITGVNAGRYDAAMSSITDNKSRQEGLDEDGKKLGQGVDFVDYFVAGTAIYVKKGNAAGIKTFDDLCGKPVGVQMGTTYETALKTLSKKCTDGGKKAVEIKAFENDTEAQTRVRAGGVVAGVNDYPVAVDLARKAGGGNTFEVVGEQFEAGPFGIAVDKKNTKLRDVLKEAVDAIIKDGSYTKVLEKWGAQTGAIKAAAINGGK
ncbi:ABC transporter substrate-binding protein [Streptomyces sp. NBC_00237]|uniref:ABC transporter substrate-binding protein n=1 Tax=Streptomyces sp. NBC_00237 TaxID=2975687 RepID=UPI00225B680F|nr:ABC transporter substrate-binding protein [Streptomyces sp. NBC_00237]MCX5204275.1 ABC transporter substrate-binding protein [Streptomyces sp. NBC_00237]